MNSFTKQRGQLLIIYLTTVFSGGASIALGVLATGKPLKELEKSIKVNVPDESRQKLSLVLLEEWKDEGKTVQKTYTEDREALFDLFKNYKADKASFKNKIAQVIELDKKTSKHILDIQYDLRKNITKEEWNKIFIKEGQIH